MFGRHLHRSHPRLLSRGRRDPSPRQAADTNERVNREPTSTTTIPTTSVAPANRPGRGYEAAAICGMLAGPILLVASLAATLAQPDEFSLVNHPSSDLGADTADLPWISNQLGSNLSGLLVLVFAVGVWSILGHRPSARIGALLIGVGGTGLFLTGVFTLDCRTIDSGCSSKDMSWQANSHLIVGLLTSLALVIAPFVVARAVKFNAMWRDLRIPSLIFGTLTIIGAVAASAVGPGLGGYALVIVWFTWITTLSIRMLRLTKTPPQDQPNTET